MSIQSGQIPTEWKQSLVVPIPKASNKSSPNGCRPISLLSVLSKVFECHIHMLITAHLTEHHMLSDNQWGFSSGKGTITALLTTTHEWFGMLENGLDVCAIFFDYQKAFDSAGIRKLFSMSSALNAHQSCLEFPRGPYLALFCFSFLLIIWPLLLFLWDQPFSRTNAYYFSFDLTPYLCELT